MITIEGADDQALTLHCQMLYLLSQFSSFLAQKIEQNMYVVVAIYILLHIKHFCGGRKSICILSGEKKANILADINWFVFLGKRKKYVLKKIFFMIQSKEKLLPSRNGKFSATPILGPR